MTSLIILKHQLSTIAVRLSAAWRLEATTKCSHPSKLSVRESASYSFMFLPVLLTYLITPCSRVLLEKLTGLKSRIPPRFTEPENSLPHSQLVAICLYSEPAKSSPYPTSHFLQIHFTIILPYMPRPPQRSLTLRFAKRNPIHASLLPQPRYMPRPSYSSRFITQTILGEEYRS
jgi:hypothetical protein